VDSSENSAIGMSDGGLDINGKLIVIGAFEEPLEVPPNFLLLERRSIVG